MMDHEKCQLYSWPIFLWKSSSRSLNELTKVLLLHNVLWQGVPVVDHSLSEEKFPDVKAAVSPVQLQTVTSQMSIRVDRSTGRMFLC